MYVLIEIAFAVLIIAVIFCHSDARKWLWELNSFHRGFAVTLIALVFAGQAFNESRKMFPFVRWSMYTEINKDDVVELGKFQALHFNGELQWVNPTIYYPSLSRNHHERARLAIRKLKDNELSDFVTDLFDQYMIAIGDRHSNNHIGNPVIEIRAVLQTAQANDGLVQTSHEVVRTLKLPKAPLVVSARRLK